MKAQITKSDGFRIALDGVDVVTFPLGTIVEGYTAKRAIECQAGIKIEDYATKVTGPDEAKAKPTRKPRTPRKKAAE